MHLVTWNAWLDAACDPLNFVVSWRGTCTLNLWDRKSSFMIKDWWIGSCILVLRKSPTGETWSKFRLQTGPKSDYFLNGAPVSMTWHQRCSVCSLGGGRQQTAAGFTKIKNTYSHFVSNIYIHMYYGIKMNSSLWHKNPYDVSSHTIYSGIYIFWNFSETLNGCN